VSIGLRRTVADDVWIGTGGGGPGVGAQGEGAQGKRGQEVMGGGSRRVVKREEWGTLCHIAQNLAIAKKVHRRGS